MMTQRANIVLPSLTEIVFLQPFLYRYENQEYINKFFETGELMIGSFKEFRKHPDNELGDAVEGKSMGFGLSNNMTFASYATVGDRAYSLCTTTVLDPQHLKTFKRDAVFVIKDPVNFMIEVGRSLNRVRQIVHGNCHYVEKKIIRKRMSDEGLNIEIDGGVSGDKMMELSKSIHGFEAYFLKHIKYQHQSEYRFIWLTDREVPGNSIISCPEAIQYCDRIELEKLS